jgi:uncharacterized protein (DUF1015 family)
MAALYPFRALRPEPAAAAQVAAVPYDVVSTAEARALAAGNPLSFLHVSRAEIGLPPGTDPYAEVVYQAAARQLARIAREAPFVREAAHRLYVYRQRMGGHVQTGVAGGFSVDEYEQGRIRRHELTRPEKEDDRTRHILGLRAQTGPVFLVYRDSAGIETVVERVTAGSPLFDFTAVDGVSHTVWMVEEALTADLVSGFGRIPALYIADGHHRAASAARARRALQGEGGHAEADRFLAVAFPHSAMQVLPYNRLVMNLAGLAPDAFRAALRARCDLHDGGPATPGRTGEVAMFLGDRWQTIVLPEAPADAPAAARLDVSRLQETVLAPLLGIGDPRTDPRIDFLGGGRGTAALEERVASGRAAVAFSMYPVRVDDLMAVADEGGIMPPKSTWFEPKLRDGLLSHVI